jgi:hypothetical protein
LIVGDLLIAFPVREARVRKSALPFSAKDGSPQILSTQAPACIDPKGNRPGMREVLWSAIVAADPE